MFRGIVRNTNNKLSLVFPHTHTQINKKNTNFKILGFRRALLQSITFISH